MGPGVVFFFVPFLVALMLGIAFAVAVCRGVQREKRESRGSAPAA